MPRFGSTFFCYKKEPRKLHGKQGIENGNVIPLGFELGDIIELCLGLPGYPKVQMVLTEETFAGSTVLLADGSEVDTENIWSVYRELPSEVSFELESQPMISEEVITRHLRGGYDSYLTEDRQDEESPA